MRIWEDLEEPNPEARFVYELEDHDQDDYGTIAWGPRGWLNPSIAEAAHGVAYIEDFTAMHARNPDRFPRVDGVEDWRIVVKEDMSEPLLRLNEFEIENEGTEVLAHTCGWAVESGGTLSKIVATAEKHLRECESPEAKR